MTKLSWGYTAIVAALAITAVGRVYQIWYWPHLTESQAFLKLLPLWMLAIALSIAGITLIHKETA